MTAHLVKEEPGSLPQVPDTELGPDKLREQQGEAPSEGHHSQEEQCGFMRKVRQGERTVSRPYGKSCDTQNEIKL